MPRWTKNPFFQKPAISSKTNTHCSKGILEQWVFVLGNNGILDNWILPQRDFIQFLEMLECVPHAFVSVWELWGCMMVQYLESKYSGLISSWRCSVWTLHAVIVFALVSVRNSLCFLLPCTVLQVVIILYVWALWRSGDLSSSVFHLNWKLHLLMTLHWINCNRGWPKKNWCKNIYHIL